jgi:sugar lactone lactonase YvrE
MQAPVIIPAAAFSPLPVPPSLLGESPFWHPEERALYWLDIPGRCLNRYQPDEQAHRQWPLPSEPGSIAPLLGGGLLIAMRDGLWRFDTASGGRRRIAAPPYDPGAQRFNDGKADAHGRFWVGTIDDKREPKAALFCLDSGALERVADGITTSNGPAFSPDGRTMYWSDTKAHAIFAFDIDAQDGSASRRRLFKQFSPRADDAPLESYGGRPDGAAVDSEGAYWCAMFEGQRLLRLSPEGELLAEAFLPVRCATMPCFGGDDLRTLYVTTAREKRPAAELERQPWAGRVLQMRVDVPGLPVHFAKA